MPKKITIHKNSSNYLRCFLPIFSLPDFSIRSSLENELSIASELIKKLPIAKRSFDNFILVNSLPRTYQSLISPAILQNTNCEAGHCIEIGSNCSSILDGIHYCYLNSDLTQTNLLMCVDSFSSAYSASSNGKNWLDGGSAILFCESGDIRIKLKSYTTMFDADFLELAHGPREEFKKPFHPRPTSLFSTHDIQNSVSISSTALEACKLNINEISHLVLTNRSQKYLEQLQIHIPETVQIVHTQASNSHRGGTDILVNLALAMRKKEKSPHYVLIIGSGLGYSWSAMILEISNADD